MPFYSAEWVKDGALLVDVREKMKYHNFMMYLILSTFLCVFEEHFTEIPKDKNVVVVCVAVAEVTEQPDFW